MFYRHNHLEYERRVVLLRAIDDKKEQGNGLEIIVGVNPKKRYDVARELSRAGSITHVFKTVPYLSMIAEAGDAEKMVRAVSSQGNGFFGQLFRKQYIKSVYLSGSFSVCPVKSRGQGMWNLERIGVYEARNHSCGEGVTISIIDTGVEYTHSHLQDNFGNLKGYDFVERNDEPMDRNGHGTHVAGISVCQEHGVAPAANLYSLRILDADGSGSEADLMAAMEWSADHGAQVWNMSLGGPSASKALEDMVYYFSSQGFYLVAAAGNQGGEFNNYPAAFPPVISCAATDSNNKRAWFSNMGDELDLSAPGVNIESCNDVMSGTSMAAPHISGVLAILASLAESNDLEDVMKDTALELGSIREYGNGLVQAHRAAEAVLDTFYVPKKILSMAKEVIW